MLKETIAMHGKRDKCHGKRENTIEKEEYAIVMSEFPCEKRLLPS